MLPPDSMEKEYEQIVRTPIVFSAGKTCFMEGTPLRLSSFFGADDGNRTRVFGLGSGHSAIELHLLGAFQL